MCIHMYIDKKLAMFVNKKDSITTAMVVLIIAYKNLQAQTLSAYEAIKTAIFQ